MIKQFTDSPVLHCSTQSKLAVVCEERLIKDHLGYLHSAINNIIQNEISSGGCALVGGAAHHCMYCCRPYQSV